jgi:hypothetical protein
MDDCVLLLSMPSIVSRLKTSLPSVHNEPITCTINGWHTATYSIPARADLRARAVPAIIQFTCYYYRQLTSYSQVEGIDGRTTLASGELNQRLVQAHAHRAGLA